MNKEIVNKNNVLLASAVKVLANATFNYYNKISYTFSGKEKDIETNYGYFGARYYNSDFSIWLSVDMMSDKYPHLSGYNYCELNPIMLIDPDGNNPIFYGILERLGQNKGGNSKLSEARTIGPYNVVPFYDKNDNLLGYNAGRYLSDGSYRTVYQMEPGDIEEFTQNVNNYKAADNLMFSGGEPNWDYAMIGYNLVNGGLKSALGSAGDTWSSTLSDPGFWLNMGLSLGVSAINISSKSTSIVNNIQQSSGKTQVTFNQGKASEFYKNLNSKWDGSLYKVDATFSRTSFKTKDGLRISLTTSSKSTGRPSVKIESKNYQIIYRFPEY